MLRVGALVLCLLSACGDDLLGDGESLGTTHDLVIVAHQDDDLLFMQPDLREAVQRGRGVTTIYVTAGNGSGGVENAEPRYAGLLQAYGAMAGSSDWRCGYLSVSEHWVQRCWLPSSLLSLVFVAYPDGGRRGDNPASLLDLWEGTVDRVTTVASHTTTYDREQLIDTLAEMVHQTQPKVVRTLEVAATHGDDHPDHMIVGALAVLAMARTDNHAELISYRGYNTANEPTNQVAPIFDASRAVLARYEACATDCAACGGACTAIPPRHEEWLGRRYAVGFRSAARGSLQTGNQCLIAAGDASVSLDNCAASIDPPGSDPNPALWILDHGQLKTANGCLRVQPDGELRVDACTSDAAQRFFLDDEGHVWSGVPPVPEGDMSFDHLWCLSPTHDGPRAVLCGKTNAPTWRFVPPLAITPRSRLNLAATGRAMRLGDLDGDGRADLCAVQAEGLYCAHGLGTGEFGAARRIDMANFAIDPGSLAVGDVDGDKRVDACGRDNVGILCARSSQAFAVGRYTATFGNADAVAGTAVSLAAVDANGGGVADICGLNAEGVVCAPLAPAMPVLRSSWPDRSALVWTADFDGDRRADWCVATPNGPACGVAAHSALTDEGVPWPFANGGAIDNVPADPARTGAADIDGDGDADLCVIDGVHIACMRSQGRGFGPRTTFAVIPAGAIALWLGDLDGDGTADACVDLGTEIACAFAGSGAPTAHF